MKFHFAYLRLTFFYVMIVMTISIVFSVVLFNISSNELEAGLGRQTKILRAFEISNNMMRPAQDIDQIRLDQIDQSEGNLRTNLFYLNVLILILSSFSSYFLAKRTLHPIEEAMKAQNCFTADASHELRTPLTAMKTEVEVALRDKNMGIHEARSLLESNLEEIGKLESLSNALLKIARFQDSAKNSFQSLSLEDVITSAYEKIEIFANQKSISFENHLADFKIMGDRQSLTELFVILLDNAIKYSPTKSKIMISMEKEKSHAVIKIRDHGVGIKSSDLPYIFNRFYRADSSRSKKEDINGYGLGLSIAKNIVEFHQGKILVTSQPGKGTEFKISFHST